jgi:very-short-patch-repair endonuclease
MGRKRLHNSDSRLWSLVESQHGIVTRGQLLALDVSRNVIEHRIAAGMLHPVRHGIYAVGRPQLTRHGRWMAAVLSCGPSAVLSHGTAAALWGMHSDDGRIHISVPASVVRRSRGITVHRRANLSERECTRCHGIPVTSPLMTLLDLATRLRRHQLEAAINEADKLDLIDPESLRAKLDAYAGRRGVAALRQTLERRTFTLTDSELERRFLPLARKAGLPAPLTGQYVKGFKVDFYWPQLGLIVETDGLRYHRTPAQQARERLRDQAHSAARLIPLRFTHAQVTYDADHVISTLAAVARRRGPPTPV